MKRFKKSMALCLLLGLFLTQSAQAGTYIMTYSFNGTSSMYQEYLKNTNGVLNTLSPSCFDLNRDGTMTLHNLDKNFVGYAHSIGLNVTPFLSNHWDKESGNAALQNIDALTDKLRDAVNEYNLDGINVDIQNVNETYRSRYTQFVAMLKQKLPAKTITVAVAANPYGWTTGWHGSYDYAALAAVSDYLMIMAYDESYYGSAPGPVASAGFVEKSITYALKYTTPDKLVLGLSFFGRYWKTGAAVGGYGIAMKDVENLAAKYPPSLRVFDGASKSVKLVLTITQSEKLWGGTTMSPGEYTIWYDDLEALKYKMELINKYELKGMGSWSLGQETPAVWQACAELLKNMIFRDISRHWSEDNIVFCYEQGWMVGDAGLFRPEAGITRAEIATLLVRVCNLQNEEPGDDFPDTKKHWAREAIAIARRFGIVEGMGNGLYAPDSPMTREQICVLLDRIVVFSNAVDFFDSPFYDVSREKNSWSYDSILKLSGNLVVEGYNDGTFRPSRSVTRAETAALMRRISGYGISIGSNTRGSAGNESAVEPR